MNWIDGSMIDQLELPAKHVYIILDFLGNVGVSVGPVAIREFKRQHDKPVRSDGKYGQRLIQDG